MTRWFVYRWEKPIRQKSHRVILRSPLSRIYYYQNKRLQVKESQYFIPTYSWTLTPIPNWTCFVVIISHFQCTTPNTWQPIDAQIPVCDLITNLRKMLAAKFFNSSHNEDHETPWSQNNPKVYKHSSFFKKKMNYVKFCLRSQFAWTRLYFTLVQLVSPLTTFKNNLYICLGL